MFTAAVTGFFHTPLRSTAVSSSSPDRDGRG